ncbi:uncharacterized protein EV154DRAFT_590926 [Mucor mucedo]|uniref:uncharacterized protein n=1 Tax=Mucor mucedo TaxID=29922 RepID=UPI00221F56B9|nr:uncharacterized protein EV154DRAFT_590926 [Mucor mucedo]KAI7896293.1 hypothetical protein EV154DRAFT_590926 [Mucor mucedo]
MTAITIHELLQSTTSCSSITTGDTLTGELLLITEFGEDTKQGTIRLIDINTRESIACLMDRFSPDFHESVVSIKQWNFIKDGCLFLEFRADDTYQDGSDLSIIRDHIVKENELFRTTFKGEVYYMPHKDLSANATHFVGKVKAITGLRIRRYTPATFLMELIDQEDNESIFISFSGDMFIAYRSHFQINNTYAFQGLERANNEQYQYSFTSATKCCVITSSQYLNEIKKVPHVYQPKVNLAQSASFAGQVTRVIDSLFGIYEIDNLFVLSLFNCPSYELNMPYRVNTRIVVHNIHPTWIHSGKENSHLLTAWNKASPCAVMGSCSKTHVDIIEFSNDLNVTCENMEVVTNHVELYIDCIMNFASFAEHIRQLELYESLNNRFNVDWTPKEFMEMFKAIMKYVLDDTNREFERCVDDFTNFTTHQVDCSKMRPDQSENIYLNSYLTLASLKANLIAQLQPYESNIYGGSNIRVIDDVSIRSSLFKEDNSYVVGLEVMTNDGRVMLSEQGTEIELMTTAQIVFDGVYIIKEARMFEEDLSYSHAYEDVREVIKHTYITCDAQNMYLVRQPLTPKFHMEAQFDPYTTIGFTCTNENVQNYSVIRILEIYPILATLHNTLDDPTPIVCMESRILVEIYPINAPSRLRRAVLVASSLTDTLDYSKICQPDDWCIISGMHEGQINTIYLDKEANHMFQISMQPTTTESSTSITPVIVSESRRRDMTRLILSVSQLTREALAPDETYLYQEYSYYTSPVHVIGVVVSKKLMDAFGRRGPLEEQDRDLYDQLGAGTGFFDRIIQVQLRQDDTPEFITIYVPVTKIHYPLGLVPGAVVTFRNLLRRSNRNNRSLTCTTSETSLIQANVTLHEEPEMARGGIIDGIAQKYVRDLVAIDEANDNGEIFRIYCSVRSILHVELKWTCKRCATDLLNGLCYRMCTDASRCFIVSAFLEVSDGYGVVLATVDGWNLIKKLLQLTEKQKNGLEQLALEYGAIKYNQFKGCRVRSKEASEPAGEAAFKDKQNALLDCTLDTLFEKVKTIGSRWMYGTLMKNKQEPSNPVLDNLQVAEIQGHKFYEEINKKIKVLDIRNADSVTYAYNEVRNALN